MSSTSNFLISKFGSRAGPNMSCSVEINFFMEAYENEEYNKDNLIKLFEEHHNFTVKFQTFGNLPKQEMERWFSPMDRTLRRELKSRSLNYWFDTTKFQDLIDLKIK